MSDVINVLKVLVSKNSVTPDDGGTLNYIESLFPDFEAEYFNKGGVSNLFLKKRFGHGEHLCLAGHVDVVPAGENWATYPFRATEQDGYIYGRGTQDMKSGVAAIVQAVQDIVTFNGTLSMLFTSDEEGEAEYGTVMVLEELKKRGELPDYSLITEPTSEHHIGDIIKVGRRGSINGTVQINGKQGHVAYPKKAINPVHLFADRMVQLAGHKFDNGDEFFEPSQLIVTDIRGGMEVTNVTPDSLKIMFNVRNSTATTKDDVEEFVKHLCHGLDYSLTVKQTSKSFITDSHSKIVEVLQNSVKSVCHTEPELTTGGGTSDARFMGEYGVKVAEFGVVNDRIHSVDERVSIDEVEKLYLVVKDVLEKF
jgi:succinyl-diaminopimelate desuccinylase